MAESHALSAVTSLWRLYDITTATEAPRLAFALLQYSLLACALIGAGRLRGHARYEPLRLMQHG